MRFVLLLFLSSMILSASYVKMLDYYKKGQYKNVLREAKRSQSEYSNPKLHLIWAKSAEKLGYTTEAMSAYERVLILDESNTEVSTELSHIYESSKRKGLSDLSYSKQQNDKLKIQADLALGHDSNLNVNPGGDVLDEYYGVVGNTGAISSNFVKFTANINYTHEFDSAEGWFLRGALNIYNQDNLSAQDYNFFMTTLSLGLGYTGSDAYSLYLPVFYDNIHYLGTNLMERYRFLPRVIIPVFQNSLLDLNAIYSKINYSNEIDKKNDSNTFGFGVGLYFPIYDDSVRINAKYEKRESDSSLNNKYIDAHFITVGASVQHPFTNALFAEIGYKLRYGKYDDSIGTLLVLNDDKRVDHFNQFDVKLGYLPKDTIEVYVKNTYIRNNSNHILTKYNKNIFMFGVDLSF